MTQKQIDLYKLFLETACNSTASRKNMLGNYYTFSRIVTHPYQVLSHQEEQNIQKAGEMDDFIVEDSNSNESISDKLP
jgi:hypothetical protein